MIQQFFWYHIIKKKEFLWSINKNSHIERVFKNIGRRMTTGYPLDNPDFKGNFQEGAMYLHKQQVLQGDVKAIEKVKFTGNIDRAWNTTMFITLEETKKLY